MEIKVFSPTRAKEGMDLGGATINLADTVLLLVTLGTFKIRDPEPRPWTF